MPGRRQVGAENGDRSGRSGRMIDPPEPGDDDSAIAEEMFGELHAIDKGLNDNHPAHLHHASHNPTGQDGRGGHREVSKS